MRLKQIGFLTFCLLFGTEGSVNLNRNEVVCLGLGIQAEHCILEIGPNKELAAIPLPGARTCVNGAEIVTRTPLRTGDRILWGSNHFFRVNCPRLASDLTPTTPFDWRMAQEEVSAVGGMVCGCGSVSEFIL